MTLYKRRERFSGFSVKVGIMFSKLGLSPNQWTVFSLLPAIIAVWFLSESYFLVAALFFGIAVFIDVIDGSVARVTGKVSKKGAYIDTIVDRYVEFLMLFGLFFVALPDFYLSAYQWMFLVLFGSIITTYAKAAAKEKEIIDKELKGGILERAERMILLFVGIIAAEFDPLYLTYILVVIAVLSNISAVQRISAALRSPPL